MHITEGINTRTPEDGQALPLGLVEISDEELDGVTGGFSLNTLISNWEWKFRGCN